MKVQVNVTVQKEVELTTQQCNEIAVQVILKHLGLDDECFIENGFVYTWDDDGGRSRPWRKQIRQATPDDLLFFEALSKLRAAFR